MAITAQTEDMQGVLELVWGHLLPALGDRGPLRRTQRSPNNCAACDYPRCPVNLPRPKQHGNVAAAPGNDQPGLTDVLLSPGRTEMDRDFGRG